MAKPKKQAEIEVLAEGGRILARILDDVSGMVRPGISTGELEERALSLMQEWGGRPAFKNLFLFEEKYFPTALCTSINEEIVHAPAYPSRTLKAGSIISIDVGMEYPLNGKLLSGRSAPRNRHSRLGGFYTDMSVTVPVGEVGSEVDHLMETTLRSLEAGIRAARPGCTLSKLGQSIQEVAEKEGYGVVRELVGHGVGYDVHEEPQVPNYKFTGKELNDEVLQPGMVIAIEPMVTLGDFRIRVQDNGFTIATADNSLSAHYEHTVVITEQGARILTLPE